MHTQEVISTLQARGVTLQVEGGNIRVLGTSRLTAEEKALLKTHKAAFLKALVAARYRRGGATPWNRYNPAFRRWRYD